MYLYPCIKTTLLFILSLSSIEVLLQLYKTAKSIHTTLKALNISLDINLGFFKELPFLNRVLSLISLNKLRLCNEVYKEFWTGQRTFKPNPHEFSSLANLPLPSCIHFWKYNIQRLELLLPVKSESCVTLTEGLKEFIYEPRGTIYGTIKIPSSLIYLKLNKYTRYDYLLDYCKKIKLEVNTSLGAINDGTTEGINCKTLTTENLYNSLDVFHHKEEYFYLDIADIFAVTVDISSEIVAKVTKFEFDDGGGFDKDPYVFFPSLRELIVRTQNISCIYAFASDRTDKVFNITIIYQSDTVSASLLAFLCPALGKPREFTFIVSPTKAIYIFASINDAMTELKKGRILKLLP